MVATLQSIIMYEFLPAFVGREASDYDGYKSFVHPGISHVFQSAAFRRVEKKDQETDLTRLLELAGVWLIG